MIYFTADTHFFHNGIIGMCNRPFADVDEMNKTLITNWNAYVSDRDEIYFLGDFAFKAYVEEVNKILHKLNGRKYLIKGNHDDKYLRHYDFVVAFEWIKDYFVLDYKDAKFILFHYPILEWAHYHGKSAHLYGHVHNNVDHIEEEMERFSVFDNRAINVGVDVNNFYPVSADTIYSRAFGQPVKDSES